MTLLNKELEALDVASGELMTPELWHLCAQEFAAMCGLIPMPAISADEDSRICNLVLPKIAERAGVEMDSFSATSSFADILNATGVADFTAMPLDESQSPEDTSGDWWVTVALDDEVAR